MQRVRRYHHDVPGFRDHADTVDRVDTSSFEHDEHLAGWMAMLPRTDARRIAGHTDSERETVLVKASEPKRRCQGRRRTFACPMR